ncbi:MarR family winged helix-turn-helix transcriptional regulator [Leptospira ilyithenensis]|uniref:MarR family transcriptional regulator n=1 Tax=Leptospira ilyithenensis TaxID=2484901 RepID=A0A4R9LM20_9LEPT|nr:MarR family transcriptional regulator [Leptospira ilyithenensis]TGN07224.1 MarR family transcriptional regulator [Leptospira ilyithenensis]
MMKMYRPLLTELNLTYPQYLVMLVLWEEDGLSVSEIGERLSLDSGTLTPLLKRMQIANLLERKRGEEDERVVTVRLTSLGKKLHTKALSVPEKIFCQMGISLQEVFSLKETLHRLGA